ncbi:MAG: DUF262 domain-containing protein, partial [Spirochaetota bacterium]|nr:DUF262 domain-containing protein [Spirochaetota bacterium]
PGSRRSPINKGLFEIWSILLSRISDAHFQVLINNREDLFNELETLYNDEMFYRSISRDSQKAANVKYRYVALTETVNSFLEN